MNIFGKGLRALAIVLALAAGSMHAKPAKADGGAVVAGIAGGLILGTILGTAAHANQGYYAPAPTYYAPTPTYVAPRAYYAPAPVYYPRPYYGSSINIGVGYYGGSKYRGYRGHRGHRGHNYRKHRRHQRRHHRRHHRH